MNMTVEIPQCNRCCFCLPLRPGLIVWGYFKIVADLLIVPVLSYYMLGSIVMSLYGDKRYLTWILICIFIALIILFMFITDFVASIIFVIAGHKKNVSPIRGYYTYSIAMLGLLVLSIVLLVGMTIVNGLPNSTVLSSIIFVACFVVLALQSYFVLLLRSEVIKLNASNQVEFVNNTAETQCMMATKQNEAATENV